MSAVIAVLRKVRLVDMNACVQCRDIKCICEYIIYILCLSSASAPIAVFRYCVCMHIYIYVCVYMYMNVCMYVFACTYVCIYVYVCMYLM